MSGHTSNDSERGARRSSREIHALAAPILDPFSRRRRVTHSQDTHTVPTAPTSPSSSTASSSFATFPPFSPPPTLSTSTSYSSIDSDVPITPNDGLSIGCPTFKNIRVGFSSGRSPAFPPLLSSTSSSTSIPSLVPSDNESLLAHATFYNTGPSFPKTSHSIPDARLYHPSDPSLTNDSPSHVLVTGRPLAPSTFSDTWIPELERKLTRDEPDAAEETSAFRELTRPPHPLTWDRSSDREEGEGYVSPWGTFGGLRWFEEVEHRLPTLPSKQARAEQQVARSLVKAEEEDEMYLDELEMPLEDQRMHFEEQEDPFDRCIAMDEDEADEQDEAEVDEQLEWWEEDEDIISVSTGSEASGSEAGDEFAVQLEEDVISVESDDWPPLQTLPHPGHFQGEDHDEDDDLEVDENVFVGDDWKAPALLRTPSPETSHFSGPRRFHRTPFAVLAYENDEDVIEVDSEDDGSDMPMVDHGPVRMGPVPPRTILQPRRDLFRIQHLPRVPFAVLFQEEDSNVIDVSDSDSGMDMESVDNHSPIYPGPFSTPRTPPGPRRDLATLQRDLGLSEELHKWMENPEDDWRVPMLKRGMLPLRGRPHVTPGEDEIVRFEFAPAPRAPRPPRDIRQTTPDPFTATPPPEETSPSPQTSSKSYIYVPHGDGDDYGLVELSDDQDEQREQIEAYMRGLAETEDRRKREIGMVSR